ncbi:hypothetical protein C5167_043608 [Papaver somniferum]|uniref:Uncharacterized protein n=1 Tax=Papaver somniferum TaxID=3469 RepID=A0A4Y7LA33_PAPSO|nr:hypothetical protein C5167_043608 [Papaver somniferum]
MYSNHEMGVRSCVVVNGDVVAQVSQLFLRMSRFGLVKLIWMHSGAAKSHSSYKPPKSVDVSKDGVIHKELNS